MSDYETEYNNRARVPEHVEIIPAWTRDAASYRAEASCELGVSYGPAPRQYYDLFRPQTMMPMRWRCSCMAATGRRWTRPPSATWRRD